MRLLILQNCDFEEPGLLLEWAREKNAAFDLAKAYEEDLPKPEIYSHLIMLGAPHSVSEIESLPWLKAEARIAERFIVEGKHVLGICLGAQLLSHLLGGKISVGPQAEVGWHRVEETGDLLPAVLFQWHREVFSLPPGAAMFGRSAATSIQGFRKGEKILALAGHPEVDVRLVNAFIERCWSEEWFSAEVEAGRADFIQRPEEMIREAPLRVAQSREAVFRWLDSWAGSN